MQITATVNGYYDWQPVPAGVEVTDQDIKAMRVRPSANSGYQMRVARKCAPGTETYTQVVMPESQIIGMMIHAYCDNGRQGKVLTRREAVAEYLAQKVMPHHANRKWMTKFEIHDDGPDAKLFDEMMVPHLAADHGSGVGNNIDAEDLDELRAAYLETCSADDHVAHLHTHFKVKPAAPAPAPAPAAPQGAVQ